MIYLNEIFIELSTATGTLYRPKALNCSAALHCWECVWYRR